MKKILAIHIQYVVLYFSIPHSFGTFCLCPKGLAEGMNKLEAQLNFKEKQTKWQIRTSYP